MGRRPSSLPPFDFVSHEGVDLRGYVVDQHTPWADDKQCQELVALHPDGMMLHEIASVMRAEVRGGFCQHSGAITRERVRQIEASALRKLRQGGTGAMREALRLMAQGGGRVDGEAVTRRASEVVPAQATRAPYRSMRQRRKDRAAAWAASLARRSAG